jgi:hypothetical protein
MADDGAVCSPHRAENLAVPSLVRLFIGAPPWRRSPRRLDCIVRSRQRGLLGLVNRGGRGILVVADVDAPDRAVAFVIDFDHRKVRHEPIQSGTVPMILPGLEEHPVARADDLNGCTTPLDEPDSFDDVDGLSVRMCVPRCARCGGEMDAACIQPRDT